MIDRWWLDQWWAAHFACTPEELRAGGVVVTDHLDHVGAFQPEHGRDALVHGPARWLEAAGFMGTERCRTVDEALARWQRGLGLTVTRVLGPARYGYASARTLREFDTSAVRPLLDKDAAQVEVLRLATPPAEWDESGMDPRPDVGYFMNGQLMAAASLGTWRGMPSVRVLTRPQHRGQGLSGAVVCAAIQRALQESTLVQYRAWVANQASLHVAERVGVVPYGVGVVVDVT